MLMHSFWILVLLFGLFFLVRWLFGSQGEKRLRALVPSSSSLEILNQRYARGEIDQAEFEKIKQDLGLV